MDNEQKETTRDSQGRFVEGHPATNKGKGGRPPKAKEAALLAIASEVVNEDVWRQIVRRRVLDALGRMQNGVGETAVITDDPESTAAGRNQAAAWIRDTIIGKPVESVRVNADDSPYDQLGQYSDDELFAILEFISGLRQARSGGETDQGGAREEEQV